MKCGVTSDKPDSEGPPLSGGRVGENAGHNRQSSLRESGWRQRHNRRAGRSNATLLFWLSPHHTGLCAGVRHTPASWCRWRVSIKVEKELPVTSSSMSPTGAFSCLKDTVFRWGGPTCPPALLSGFSSSSAADKALASVQLFSSCVYLNFPPLCTSHMHNEYSARKTGSIVEQICRNGK